MMEEKEKKTPEISSLAEENQTRSDNAPDQTTFIPMDEIADKKDPQPLEGNEKYSFPWLAVIVIGILVILIIVCIIMICILGGPVSGVK